MHTSHFAKLKCLNNSHTFNVTNRQRGAWASCSYGWEIMVSLWTCTWPVGMPSSESVNSLHLEAEVPPALTAQGGGMNPVDGQLLANLPDLGVEEEVRVNDGLLGRNPHLGILHLHVHGLCLIHLLENTTRTHMLYIHMQGPRECPYHTKCAPTFALSSPEPCSSSGVVFLSITSLSAERTATS